MYKCAQLVTMFAVLLASVGCARWTLRPQPDMAAQALTDARLGQQAVPPSAPQPTTDPRGPMARLAGMNPMSKPASDAQDFSTDLKSLDPSLSIARLSERQGDPQQARQLYLRYIAKNPRHPLPYHRLGVMAAREAKYDEAQEHFTKALQMAPPSVELLSDVGYMYYLLDRLDEAEQVLRQAGDAEPANAMVQNNLALVMAAKGDFNDSMRTFRRVNDEGPARANMAYALSQNGELEHARQEYLRALSIDNKLTNAAKALLQVDEAYKMEQQSLARSQQHAPDPLLSVEPQPSRQPAGYPQGVAQVAYEAPAAQPAQAAAVPPPEQIVERQQPRDVAPRGNDMAAMLMPVPSGPSQLPAAAPPRQEVATAGWWTEPSANSGAQPAGWIESPYVEQKVQPAAATAKPPAEQPPRKSSGVAISLSDEPAAPRQKVSASLSDTP